MGIVKKATPAQTKTERAARATAFSFGDPEPVIDKSLGSGRTFLTGSGARAYFEPPVNLTGLAKLFHANAHHGSIPFFIRNMVLKYYRESPLLPHDELGKLVIDLEKFGNAYLQVVRNRFGETLALKHLPAVQVRRMKTENQYALLDKNGKPEPIFAVDEVLHMKEYDPLQSIYGLPQYLGGMQSVLLAEDATLFRRKFYKNGAHMGYVFFTNDKSLKEEDKLALQQQIADSKGAGNFRSLFVHIPGGSDKAVQIIPVGEIATKDEFERVKNLARNDVIAMWRVQPALAGVLPENTGGFGDIQKISRVYLENEIFPRQKSLLDINRVIQNKALFLGFDNPQDSVVID
jgi:PBSX family phage portal protein